MIWEQLVSRLRKQMLHARLHNFCRNMWGALPDIYALFALLMHQPLTCWHVGKRVVESHSAVLASRLVKIPQALALTLLRTQNMVTQSHMEDIGNLKWLAISCSNYLHTSGGELVSWMTYTRDKTTNCTSKSCIHHWINLLFTTTLQHVAGCSAKESSFIFSI